jgi:hypothetical protein
MKANHAMKPIIFALVASFWSSCAFGADAPQGSSPVAAQSSFVWAKLASSMSSTSSKPGDPVTALVMGPGEALLGATLEGTVDRAEGPTLAFSFQRLRLFNGKTYAVQSRLISIVNSKGIAGQDDLGQRVGENAGITAYGITTALNEGSEIHLSVWEKR